ncbi:MAG: hypothetical protein FWE41_05270 [Coriobacteriia bacterium]|nr:hypothetical protein [Coriobacteriia bacterium]MCL2750335.1 hypothetical protein [Coriobacteriia bacterium]
MKKLVAIVLAGVLFLTLAACDPMPYSYDRNELQNSVVGIELIYYANPEQKRFKSWVPNHYSKLLPFDFAKMRHIKTLDKEHHNDFITQLSEASMLYRYYSFDSPNGFCIRLLYSNGDFEIITTDYTHDSFQGYAGRYNSEGKVVDFAGTFDWGKYYTDLVYDYFEMQL